MNKNQVNNHELSDKITNILDSLKTSPAFAMSRGGRELFHTNFLAFILEQTSTKSNKNEYGQLVKKSLLSQIFEDKNLPSNVKVFREKLNLDLIIIPIDDFPALSEECNAGNPSVDSKEKQLKIVVIEAKLKSIPTIQQLNNYSNNLEKIVNIDLYEGDGNSKLKIDIAKSKLTIKKSNSNVEPNEEIQYKEIFYDCFLLAPQAFALEDLTQESISKSKWKNLNWNVLFQKLKSVKCNSNDDTATKLSIFIKDYIDSTNDVLKLISLVIEFMEAFIEKDSNLSLSDLCQFAMHDSFKRLKLHDLVGKVAYEFLAKKIHKSLHSKGENLRYKAFLSNSTPGFEIEFFHSGLDNKQEIGIGVQLQGSDYRHFIKRNFSEIKESLTDVAEKYRNWLSDIDDKEKARNFGKGKDKTEYKKFNKDRFLYLSRSVNMNFEELCGAFKRSLEGAENIYKEDDFKKQF